MKKVWNVDLPDPRNIDGQWVCVGEFETRKAAREFCDEHGLSSGKIDLVSGVEV